jgi:hypothetical protein
VSTVAEPKVATGTKVVQARNVNKVFKRDAFEVKALDGLTMSLSTSRRVSLWR